jgi:segregation and condensation protein A
MNSLQPSTKTRYADKGPVYKITIPTFSGPLDLLLHLIERNELDITAISLATVADQYLRQIEKLKEKNVEDLMDFLVIGARLLVIKSRALLPQLPPELTEDDGEEDPAEALARQLRLYRRFKLAASWLREREEKGLRTYLRVAPPPKLDPILDMTGINLNTLEDALLFALSREALRDDSVSVAVDKRNFTIEGQVTRMQQRISEMGRVYFDEVLSSQTTWSEVSVTLLAVLELIKRHEVNVRQPELFGKIEIVRAESNN